MSPRGRHGRHDLCCVVTHVCCFVRLTLICTFITHCAGCCLVPVIQGSIRNLPLAALSFWSVRHSECSLLVWRPSGGFGSLYAGAGCRWGPVGRLTDTNGFLTTAVTRIYSASSTCVGLPGLMRGWLISTVCDFNRTWRITVLNSFYNKNSFLVGMLRRAPKFIYKLLWWNEMFLVDRSFLGWREVGCRWCGREVGLLSDLPCVWTQRFLWWCGWVTVTVNVWIIEYKISGGFTEVLLRTKITKYYLLNLTFFTYPQWTRKRQQNKLELCHRMWQITHLLPFLTQSSRTHNSVILDHWAWKLCLVLLHFM